jgi:hypothetical protein
MFKKYDSAIWLVLLLILQLSNFTSEGKSNNIQFLKRRRLVSCSPQAVKIMGYAGKAGDITIQGDLDSNARINIIGYQQDCSNNVYNSAPNTASVSPTVNEDGSVTFVGIRPFLSGRFSICLSCDNGITFPTEVGMYQVEPRILVNHTFYLYNNRVGYINVSGYGLDIIDRLKIVQSESWCHGDENPEKNAPETMTNIPSIKTNNRYALFGPFVPDNITFVNKFHVCYAFDGITFNKYIGTVYIRPVFPYLADNPFNLTLKGPRDDAFHATDSKIAFALYHLDTSCRDDYTITTEGFSVNPSSLSTTRALPTKCTDPAYTLETPCKTQGVWTSPCSIDSGGRQVSYEKCIAAVGNWDSDNNVCDNSDYTTSTACATQGVWASPCSIDSGGRQVSYEKCVAAVGNWDSDNNVCDNSDYTTSTACTTQGVWTSPCSINSGGRQVSYEKCIAPAKEWINSTGCVVMYDTKSACMTDESAKWVQLINTIKYLNISTRVANLYRICYGTDGINFPIELGMLHIIGQVNYKASYRLSVGFPSPILVSGSGLDASNRVLAISSDSSCKKDIAHSAYSGAPDLTNIVPSITLNRIAIFPNVLAEMLGNYKLCYKITDVDGYIHDIGMLSVVCGGGIITREGSRFCSLCVPGYYDNVDGEGVECLPCLKGQYSISPGSETCTECIAGKYSPEDKWSEECIECASGYYSDLNGSETCIACNAGQFNGFSGKVECQVCNPGRYSTYSAASACIDCDIGQYVSTSSAAECIFCVAGYYSNETGAAICKDCAQGQFAAVSGASACTMCKPGYWILARNSLVCKECNAGQYQDNFGSSECKLCEVGYFRPDDESPNRRDPSSCIPCAAGLYLDVSGRIKCKDCPIGYYQDEEGQTDCTACGSRTYSNARFSTCLPQCQCATGYFGTDPSLSLDLSSMCEACPIGHVCPQGKVIVSDPSIIATIPSDALSHYGKLECDPDLDGINAHFCTLKSPGKAIVPPGYVAGPNDYHTTFKNKSKITLCPRGSRCNKGVAIPCVAGKYAPIEGMSYCHECPSGRYSNDTGFSECFVCPRGYYCPAGTSVPCRCGINNERLKDCGNYTKYDVGGAQQFYCPGGSPYRKAATAGFYTRGNGFDIMDRQVSCPVGGECIMGNRTLCPGGRYQNEEATSTCKICIPGMFSTAPIAKENDLNVLCTACPVGRRAQSPEMTYCDACIPGKFNNVLSQATCKNCNPGLFSNTNATVLCTKCFKGQWNAEPGRTDCDFCLKGTDTEDKTGYTKCVGCPPGRVTNKIGTGKCKLCSDNPPQYQDISGQQYCKACMPGRASNDARTACAESGRNVLYREAVTHSESYTYVRSRHRLQAYFEINADPTRTIDVDGEAADVRVQREEVYGYEVQFGIDRSFSDLTRISKVRGLLLNHEKLVEPPEEEADARPIFIKNINVENPYCSDPSGNQLSLGDDTEFDIGNATTHDELCRLRTSQSECNAMQDYQLAGETIVSCIWTVPLLLWPCTAQLGSQNAGQPGYECGSIIVETKENLFDDCVYARVVPILMPDPFKLGGDIPMPVPLRASGAVYADNPNPFTKFLPWTTSRKCGDRRYLETRMNALKYGFGKNMEVKKLVADVYGEEFLPDPYKWECVNCPYGGSCKGDIFWEGIKPLFGNWRARRKGVIEFYRCTYEWACLGVMNLDMEARGYMRSSNAETWTTADYMPNAAVSHPDAEWAKRQYALELDENGDLVDNQDGTDSIVNASASRDGNIKNLQAANVPSVGFNKSTLNNEDDNEGGLGLQAFANGPIEVRESDNGIDIVGDFNLAEVNHREKCLFGYRGPVCGLCISEPKFFMSPEGCKNCEAQEVSTQDIINTVLLAVLALLVVICVYLLIKNQLDNLEAMDAIISDMKLLLKIMMNFMQLLSSIPSIITIEMPPQLFSFLVSINFVQFDMGGIIGLPCIDQGDAFESYKLDLYIMGGLCGAVILKSTISVMRKAGCCPKFCGGRLKKKIVEKSEDESARDKIRKHIMKLKNIKVTETLTKKQEYMRALLKEHADGTKKKGLHTINASDNSVDEEEDEGPKTIIDVLYGARTTIFMIMLFYHTPTMVKTFNFFRCVTVDGIDYLEMDLRIICWTPRHIGMCVFAGFVAIIYGVGLPLGLFLFLLKKRWELHKPKIRKAFGFLMGDYKPNAFFWETLIIVQKMLLTGGLVIFYEYITIQISLAIIFSGMYQVLSSKYNPFDSYAAGLLNDVTAITETIVYLSALTRRAMETSPSQFEDGQEDAVGIFIVIVLQTAFAFSLVAAGLSIWDNANAIEADIGEDGWHDDEVDQRTYKEKLIHTYHDQKYKLSLHHMTGGLLGKMSKSHPDYGKHNGPSKIQKPSTGLKKLPPHLQSRIRAKKKKKSGASNKSSRSPSPQEQTSQGRSSLMSAYRKKKLKKTSRKDTNKKQDTVSVGEHTSAQGRGTRKLLKKKRKVKKFSVTAEEI